MINVYDDLIETDLHKDLYRWGQSVSWYHRWYAVQKTEEQDMSINEYQPSVQGNFNNKHILGSDRTLSALSSLMKFSMYRHPIGWDDKSTKERNPLVYDLWTKINNHVWNGKASLDGLPEGIGGLNGPRQLFNKGKSFYEKYDVDVKIKKFTSYMNCRCTEVLRTGGPTSHMGQHHRDTKYDEENNHPNSDKYFTVLYNLNQTWNPIWGGELMFYDEEDTGYTHWNREYNIGYPIKVVGHKPSRVVIYPHNITHSTQSPKGNAPEMTQKLAFRVKVDE